ncbi:MAG TPA: Hsp20/alpha crystallin family protein [Verrucomicrobiae bacterium]|nr:Hsp20/alpha crystallin family protein [Verrucomicrobiae bacterium]
MSTNFEPPSHWSPQTDIVVRPGVEVIILLDLPGIQRQHLELSAESQRLHIAGDRPDGERGSPATYLRMERPYGPFACSVEVPSDYDIRQAKAVYQNGILRIVVPARNGNPDR